MTFLKQNYIIVLLCTIIIGAILMKRVSAQEGFKVNDIAACLICRYPNKIWLDFLKSFTQYDVFVVVDYNKDLTSFKNNYPTITFVQISADDCRRYGYINMNFVMHKDCTGWEKALYYFSKQASYKHVWFFEDDVFFRKEQDLLTIDKKYPNSDLLSAPAKVKNDAEKWHWSNITVTSPEPHYYAMCCAVRVSKALLEKIETIATKHKTLYFLEALFPTEAHAMKHDTPDALQTITPGTKHDKFLPGNIYHPVKDIDSHNTIRNSSP